MQSNYEARFSDIIFYSSPEGSVKVEVIFNDETFWLSQKRMAELFGVEVPAISKHLRNIFLEGELSENSVVSKMETTAADGKNYNTTFYNLDAIIAVGYRVNSKQATQFRIWATKLGVIPKVVTSFHTKWSQLTVQTDHSISLKSGQSAHFKGF